MASVDPVRTSFAGATASQLQLTNAAAAASLLVSPLAGCPLPNQYSSAFAGLSPLLSQPNLNSMSLPGANAAGLGGMYLGPGSSPDPNVELANTLSRLMLGPTSQLLAQQNLMTSMFAASPQAGLQTLLMQQRLQSLLSGASLLSPADQQQLLLNAGLLSSTGQTATHDTTTPSSAIHSTTMLAGSAPVNQDRAGLAAQAGQFGTAAGGCQHQYPPPGKSGR